MFDDESKLSLMLNTSKLRARSDRCSTTALKFRYNRALAKFLPVHITH